MFCSEWIRPHKYESENEISKLKTRLPNTTAYIEFFESLMLYLKFSVAEPSLSWDGSFLTIIGLSP